MTEIHPSENMSGHHFPPNKEEYDDKEEVPQAVPDTLSQPEFTNNEFVCEASAIITLTNRVAHHQMICRHLLTPTMYHKMAMF